MPSPRILIVTPEITYLPEGMGNMAQRMTAKAGGLADVSASLVAALFEKKADVHVAMPNYRRMFSMDVFNLVSGELRKYHEKLPAERIHLAEDRIFYYRDQVYSGYNENLRVSLVFQREVINNIIPRVRPDLIHCNDWMTGLIPAMARRLNIKCLFTVHNIHTEKVTLEQIEETGIDAAEFWSELFFTRTPANYEESRTTNTVDMLTSGIFGAHYINTVSPSFLDEIVEGRHGFIPPQVRAELTNKKLAGCAEGILNAPDPSYDPATDPSLARNFTADDLAAGKAANKRAFQEMTGLDVNAEAPVFFWPSRLDPVQKGPQLLTDILYRLVSDYWKQGLQVAVVANGAYQKHFRDVVAHHGIGNRVCVCDFSEPLSRLGYAASDFMVMPSSFEPCGLPQMVSPLYGSLAIAHRTGGLKDTVEPLDAAAGTGNGFLFDYWDAAGLRWAVDQAMEFHALPRGQRDPQIARVMRESAARFTHAETAQRYMDIYEAMLQRPLL
ncbi:MAG: glycogen/starch synthase [Verrucomicrobiales bacterium]